MSNRLISPVAKSSPSQTMKEALKSLKIPLFLGIVSAGAFIALVLLHKKVSLGADEVVAFIGTVVGTAGTILGALYVERAKRIAADARDHEVLRASLTRLQNILGVLANESLADKTAVSNYERELDLLGQLRHAMMETDAVLGAAAYGTRSGDADLIVLLHRVRRVIDYRLPLLTKAVDEQSPAQEHLDDRATQLLIMGVEASETLAPAIQDAIKKLQGRN